MNQDSSRSHSVFTCVIESQWVTGSMTSIRYGRLNLVDLAGSERQKASGAEGERLREAAYINKSLSTLGLVIMILVDVAQGKQRHVPYRDSKLTYLLQDSLGGNSKTAIIATVSPAISCANETMSTLKFAQRAKFIQNNAIINEDASGDVKALRSQIQDLKKELEKLRDQTQLSRLSAVMKKTQTSVSEISVSELVVGSLSSQNEHDLEKKQVMEEILKGCLRREQEAVQENNGLAAENQELNSLLQVYERDINYVKTMLQLKEDKIQRLKKVEDSVMSAEDCLKEENRSLQQELHLLKERMNKHPELLRFAFENKHLIQQLRGHDDFYGREREMLMAELANLRHEVLNILEDKSTKNQQKEQTESSTQIVGHNKEDKQTACPKNRLHERMLVTKEHPQICNTIGSFSEGEEAQTKIMSFLEEGDRALGEALQEVESMSQCTHTESEDEPTSSTHAKTIDKGDNGVTCLLQQVFDMVKEVEEQFKVLCDVAVCKDKRSESMKTLLSTWSDRYMKSLQSAINNVADASDVHKLDQKCSPRELRSKVSLQDCSLPKKIMLSEEDCESHEALSDDAFTDVQNNDSLYFGSMLRDEPKREQDFIYKYAKPNISKHEAKEQVYCNFLQQIKIVVAMMQESLDIERQKIHSEDLQFELHAWKSAFKDDFHQTCMKAVRHERVLIQLQMQLSAIYHMLADDSNKLDTLCKLMTSLKAPEKQRPSAKMDLNHQVLELQSDAIGRERETATLAASVERLWKGEEGMTDDLINLNQQFKYSERQRLFGKHLYKQSVQDNKEHHIKASLKLQKLITEVLDVNHTIVIVRKQMEVAIASLQETEIRRRRMEEASKEFMCTGKGKIKIDPLDKELENAYQSVAQMQTQLMGMESQVTSMMAKLEGRFRKAQATWREEKAMILMELDKTKLDAAQKIGEAGQALSICQGSQEIIREAELMVSALTKANETARIQQIKLMNQWHEERDSMVGTIRELKSLIVQKEDELQMKEREIQQMIPTKSEIVMLLAQKQFRTFVPDDAESISSATVNMNSEKTTNKYAFKQEILAAISQLNNQHYAQKYQPSVHINKSVKSGTAVLSEKLDLINMPLRHNNNLGSTHDHCREEKQNQVTAAEIEAMLFQYTQLEHKTAQELARQFEEGAMLKTELEESRYSVLQAHNFHAASKLILQGKGREETMLQGAELLGSIDRVKKFQSILQKTSVNTLLKEESMFPIIPQKAVVDLPFALQSYDESTCLLLEKLEGIVYTISDKPGGEDVWVHYMNSYKLALSKLEEDANLCLSFSNVICDKLDKTLAEKQQLEQELERKQELLKGSFFDLRLLQESTAEYINTKSKTDGACLLITSLEYELNIKDEMLKTVENEYANLQHENIESIKRARFLETSLFEAQQTTASTAKHSADMRQNMQEVLTKMVSLEGALQEKTETIEKLELELLKINFLVEQKMSHSDDSVKQELNLTLTKKDQLQIRLLTLEEQLDATRMAADTNKRLADEAQQIVETNKSHLKEKEKEVKLLEKSVLRLDNTINALENQIEILKREAELQQLSKEDLEMELQAFRHQQLYISEDIMRQHPLTAQIEITTLREELAEKSAEIRSLKLQVEELINAAEKQATAHHHKLVSLEAMADNLNLERGQIRQVSPTTRKAGERNVAKCSTSPFKCISLGMAQQINFEMDEELYSNRCRIDKLEDLAASRQKEIFRLNKKLAEAESMTYDVIRDLLGVKSDIATHATYLDHIELEGFPKVACHHIKTAIHQENEMEALRAQYNEERASWLEDTGRRQAEVVATRVAVAQLRQKDFLLKAENKRLKADLSRQKRRLLQLQDKMKTSLGQGTYHQSVGAVQDDDLQEELRRTEALLGHINSDLAPRRQRRVDFER